MTHGSLFSGIGGFDLAAQWMGWENVLHCEINPFGRQVLNYYWPNAISYEDITKTDFTIHGGTIDVLTGGFPCQPFSLAGKRKGKEDDRYLWPEMLRAIDEIRPRWVCGENVAGIVSMVQPEANRSTVESTADLFGEEDSQVITEYQQYVIETVCNDLERIGYSVQPVIIPACAVGAPHRRDRVWFVAYAESAGMHGKERNFRKEDGGSGAGLLSEFDKPSNGFSSKGAFVNSGSKPNGKDISGDGKSDGLEVERNELHSTGRQKGSDDIDPSIGSSNATHSAMLRCECDLLEGERLHGKEFPFRKIGTSDHQERCFGSTNPWINFPTQPAFCGRNDGVPAGLAGITVSKHRNESIKAYGNAIVPQVVYRIFKAIQEYETPNMVPK